MIRVVSLVPSVTETLLAWNLNPIAVTRFCEQGSRFETVGGTKDPDIDAIARLRPDLVVVCDQENRKPDALELQERGLALLVLRITHVDHVVAAMTELAQALGLSDPSRRGAACGIEPQSSGAALRVSPDDQRVGHRDSQPTANRRTAFVPIWKRPWMTLNHDTYATSLLAALGVDSVAAGDANRYPEMNLEAAAHLRPDIVIAPDEPYVFGERNRAELETVGPTIFVNGKDLFWWGVRTPAAAERLRQQLSMNC